MHIWCQLMSSVHFCLTLKDFWVRPKAFVLGIFKAVRINPLKNIHFSDKVGGGGSLLSEPDRSITASPRLWLKTCHWQLFLTRRPTQSNHLKPWENQVFFVFCKNNFFIKMSLIWHKLEKNGTRTLMKYFNFSLLLIITKISNNTTFN